ncbi:HD domain-containing protein [Mobilitalea sibirica]|uniref:HD domain-containing protein n=1 Tax=Mobilitalea sibirica TaxID=1462919 RepID=A0A8J7H4B9_9FIRM|nr:HD domain-containing phosphohydrolase [Mobilitalea sibirica]MBH1941957.1 HD domain-containing protein [Mobilitalea sibirica]
MRIISVDSVKGNELLAKDILNTSDSVLMAAGTVVKKEYVKRLKDLNIDYIYVEDEIAQGVNLIDSLEIQIKEQCQEAIREILLKYTYHNINELQEIKVIADEIINDIIREPEVIYNLSSIRNKSESTYSHSLNVCALSVILAIKLKQPIQKVREIAIGCLLHDIGFTYITMDYINLTVETCSEVELKEIKKHIIYGYSAVEKMQWLSPIAKDIIISHHERLDGSGYPFHLKEAKIKLWSKIAAVCDEFDSKVYGNLTSKMKVHDAIDYIVSQAGIKFDFHVVKALMDSVAAYPTGALVMTNLDEVGIVLRQNTKCPTRPVIRIIKTRDGKKPTEWIEKDLTKELTLFITDTILD